MEKNKKLNDMLNEYIRPLTYPVAVKIFKKGEEIGFKVRTPLKDLNYGISLCQGITIARKYGWVFAFRKEDQRCPMAQVILGYVEEPDFIKNGSLVYPLYTGTMEAGAKTQAATPKMPAADTDAIVLAPLPKAEFEPDVVIIYGNAAQIVRMVQGGLYQDGGCIESQFSGRGACGGEIVVPFTQNKYNVVIPGGGERVFALTADDELVFALPGTKINEFMEGVIKTHEAGAARFPTPVFGVRAEPKFPKYYLELEKYCGFEV